MENEVWKDIPNYEGLYQASNLGNIKSLNYRRKNKEQVLKTCFDKYQYLRLELVKNKKGKVFRVHQLVAMAFLNHKPCGYKFVVDHINNNQLDNRVENLQVITQRENVSKDIPKGTSKYIGVFWDKSRNKWKSSIRINGKTKHLGRFESEYEAHLKYQEALKNIEL